MAEKEATDYYPRLVVKPNTKPNRWYAVPFLGFLFKTIILLPVFLWCIPLAFASLFFWMVTPFFILFTGKYWDTAYHFQAGYMHLSAKIYLFYAGISDKYPGFALKGNDSFTLTIHKPVKCNRWLSLPVFGFIVRYILLIPYFIFASVMNYGAYIAVFISWFTVLFKGKYPESLHEFTVDSIRVSFATEMGIEYLSDKYPSFSISMRHQTVKILLIIGGAMLAFSDVSESLKDDQSKHENYRYDRYNYEYSQEDMGKPQMQYRDW